MRTIQPVVAVVEDVDARGRLLEVAEVRAAAGERMRDEDPVDAAVEHGERGLPLLGEQPVERRQHAVERLAERLAAEEARLLVADLQRADEHLLELLGRDRVEAAAAPLVERGPLLGLAARRDHRRRLDSPRQRARHDEVEAHVLERPVRGCCLLEPALGQAHDLRVALADVRDLGMPHQIETPPHGA